MFFDRLKEAEGLGLKLGFPEPLDRIFMRVWRLATTKTGFSQAQTLEALGRRVVAPSDPLTTPTIGSPVLGVLRVQRAVLRIGAPPQTKNRGIRSDGCDGGRLPELF